MTDNKLTIAEAAQHFDVSERTIRRWVESGKLVAERTNGQRFVLLDTRTEACPNDQTVDKSVSIPLESENKNLRDQLQRADSEIESLRDQLSRKDEQIDHLTQVVAMSQKNIATLSEQNQLLLEDQQRRPWWKRIFRW